MDRKKWARALIILSILSMVASFGLVIALLFNYQRQQFVNQEGVVIDNEITPNIGIGEKKDFVLNCNLLQKGKMTVTLSFSNTDENSKFVYASLSYKDKPLFKEEEEVGGENISLVHYHCINNYDDKSPLTDEVTFENNNNELIFSLYVSNYYDLDKFEASFSYNIRISRVY